MPTELRDFLTLSYDELEELNLKRRNSARTALPPDQVQEERLKYLTDEKRIKAVTVLFSDLEGRLHMLDYDKKFLLKSWDNLTFDGSPFEDSPRNGRAIFVSASTGALFIGRPPIFSAPAKCWYLARSSTRSGTPYLATFAAFSKDTRTSFTRRRATR